MAPKDRSPPYTLPAGGPRTAKKRKKIKRISLQYFNGEDDPLDQKSQGSLWQVAATQGQPMASNHEPVSLKWRAAQEVETQERRHEGQESRTSEPEYARTLENEAPMPGSQADNGVQVAATNGSGPQDIQQAGNQSLETANSRLVQSRSSHRLSETHVMACSGHERSDGAESDFSYATAREEVHEDRKERNIGYNSPVASPPTIQVHHPTPPIIPARLAQHLKSRPSETPRTLAIHVENRKDSSGVATEQNTTGRGCTEASNNNAEALIGGFTAQNANGAGQLTDSTDDWRASTGRPVKSTTGQIPTEPVHQPGHNQDSRVSSGSTIEQSAHNFGDTPAPDQAIEAFAGASARDTITQNLTGIGDQARPSHNSIASAMSTTGHSTSAVDAALVPHQAIGASALPPHSDAIGQNTTRCRHLASSNQDIKPSARSTSGQSASSVGDNPVAGQAIGASARPTSGQNITGTEDSANEVPTENIRPTPQNLRYGTYPSQQGPQTRNPPLGSSRLQNTTKLGNGTTTWGLGAQTNGGYPRPSGVGTASFAQTIGGSQPNTSLDSEFPALGANSGQAQLGNNSSQAQYQNASPAIWANQRAIQQTPVQRPQQQQQHAVNPQPSQQHQQTQSAQDQSQRGNDDLFASTSHLQSVMDDNRYQSALGQMPISRQPPTTNADEYPPLGRNSTDENDDRRANMLQNAGFGSFSNANAFSLPQEQSQSRNQPPSASSSQADNSRPSAGVDRLTSPNGIRFGATSGGRSPLEPIRQGHSGVQDHDRNNVNAIHGNQRNENTMNALLTNFGDSQFPPQQTATQPSHGQQEYGGRIGDPPGSARTPDRTPTSQMSAMDEFGLAGFLATVRSDNPDVAGLARGQDLTSLGLNLNSPEPLYPTFAGPFAEPGSRPFQPDFRLPECYTVDNVHRVRDKIPGFTEETLFWIFYTQPQDILQELAASELESRNWRFHKQHRMWLTKDPSLQEPVTLGPEKENGSYIFFNHTTWERIRLSNFDLHYNQLAPTSARPTGQ